MNQILQTNSLAFTNVSCTAFKERYMIRLFHISLISLLIFWLDATSPVFLKDLNKRTTAELSFRLQNDEVAMRRFGQAFGLDDVPMISAVQVIDELFPDTPVQLLKDVCKALQLHDLEDLLEKVKPCTLRLALSPKEIEKLPNADNRPTNFYGRAEVLIIHGEETTAHDTKEKFESFFRQFDFLAGSQVTTVKSNLEQLMELGASIDLSRAAREQGTVFLGESRIVTESMQLSPEERRKELAKELKQKEEELQKEMDKFEIAVSAVVNRWTRIEGWSKVQKYFCSLISHVCRVETHCHFP